MGIPRVKFTEGIAAPVIEAGIFEFTPKFVKSPGQTVMGVVNAGAAPVAGTNNNYDTIRSGVCRLNPVAANADLSGIVAPGFRFKRLILMNISAFNITLLDQNAGSLAVNRFNMGGNYVLQAKRNVELLYDPIQGFWTVMGNEATFVS